MRAATAILSVLLLSSSLALAQTGYTTHTYAAGPGESTIRVADFNQDGRPDLLVYGSGGTYLHVYTNNRTGGFNAPIALTSQYGDFTIAKVVDLNGDGFPDIVACTTMTNKSPNPDTLVTFLNDRNGNFTPGPASAPLNGSCTSLVVGDVNLDGRADVVVGSYTYANSSGNYFQNIFQTFFSNGAGGFSSTVAQTQVNLDIPSTVGDTSCIVADMTGGNFYLDNHFSLLVTANCAGDSTQEYFGTVFLAHGDGSGHFTFTPSNPDLGHDAHAQTVDLNLDGRPDALFAATGFYGGQGELYAAINDGSGHFTYNSLFSSPGYNGITSADLNGDGIPDIATSSSPISSPNSGGATGPSIVNIYTGSKSGTFTAAQSWSIGNTTTAIGDIVAADFNGDGLPDLATLVIDESNSAYNTQLYVYTKQAAQPGSCAAPSSPGVHVCAPTPGQTASSPVNFIASGTGASGTVNHLELWVDGNKVGNYNGSTLNANVSLSSGSHSATIVEVDSKYSYIKSTPVTFTVGQTGACAAPSAPGVHVCAPAAGQTVNSPVNVIAGGTGASGTVNHLELWVDGHKIGNYNGSMMNTNVALSAGSHTATVIEVDSKYAYIKSVPVTFTAR